MAARLGLKLISASPSPYARKVRIALAEKGIPFRLQTEVPWDSTTQTPLYNPLEKVPILLVPNGTRASDSTASVEAEGSDASVADGNVTAVYESRFILEWLETKYPEPPMLPADPEQKLAAKQVEVVCDGTCDALVLRLFETKRDPERQSPEWLARQERKIHGGVKWLNEQIRQSRADGSQKFLVGPTFGLADIAAGSLLGYMDVRAKHIAWQTDYPALKTYFDGLMQRQSFGTTVPYAQPFQDKIV